MSNRYINQLRAVRDELKVAREAVTYLHRHWEKHSVLPEMEGVRERTVEATTRNLESTYFIRLYAEFEGILKGHLATNHSQISLSDKPKVDWLINRVVRAEDIPLEKPLRIKMDQIRDYRNSIAHRNRSVPLVSFSEALSTLNTFLAKLPDPLR